MRVHVYIVLVYMSICMCKRMHIYIYSICKCKHVCMCKCMCIPEALTYEPQEWTDRRAAPTLGVPFRAVFVFRLSVCLFLLPGALWPRSPGSSRLSCANRRLGSQFAQFVLGSFFLCVQTCFLYLLLVHFRVVAEN